MTKNLETYKLQFVLELIVYIFVKKSNKTEKQKTNKQTKTRNKKSKSANKMFFK